jgi:hypothetical protein
VLKLPEGNVVYALTPEDFNRLTSNEAALARFAAEARRQLQYYRGEFDGAQ